MKLDEKDLRILEILKENSRLSTYKIAKKTLIPVTTVHNRIKKLEREGVVEGYTVKLNNKKLGKEVSAYILVEFDINTMLAKKMGYYDLAREIRKPGIVEDLVYTTGQKDIIIKIRAHNMEEINNYLLGHLRKVPGILRSDTHVVLQEF